MNGGYWQATGGSQSQTQLSNTFTIWKGNSSNTVTHSCRSLFKPMWLESWWTWAWHSPGATQHKPLTTLIIRIPPWHWLNHATYAFPIPAATDRRPDSPLSQFMPPCDFCSLRASMSKFPHLSLLLPPLLCNSTNSLNERIDFLVGSLTNQVTYMGRVRPGYLLDPWQAELAAHEWTDTHHSFSQQRQGNVGDRKHGHLWTTTVASLLSKRSCIGDPSDKKLWDVTLHSFPYKLQSSQWF